jgi:hypothetical protein
MHLYGSMRCLDPQNAGLCMYLHGVNAFMKRLIASTTPRYTLLFLNNKTNTKTSPTHAKPNDTLMTISVSPQPPLPTNLSLLMKAKPR